MGEVNVFQLRLKLRRGAYNAYIISVPVYQGTHKARKASSIIARSMGFRKRQIFISFIFATVFEIPAFLVTRVGTKWTVHDINMCMQWNILLIYTSFALIS